MNAPKRDWNERYATGDLPWDTGRHDRCLEKLVSTGAVEPCRALELGCGTGSNAIWMALQGFDVSAVDLSPLAISRSRPCHVLVLLAGCGSLAATGGLHVQ